jgi:hypothetical protein
MMDMHYVTARFEIVKPCGSLSRPCPSTRSTTAGEIGLCEHAEASPWKMESSMKGSNGDVGAWRGEVALCVRDPELKFVIEH